MPNNLRMKWKSKSKKQALSPSPKRACHDHRSISDEKLELLGRRFQANNICYLLDITFEAYLLAPEGWDRIAKHLNDGGGCRMLEGMLVINEQKEGVCAWCARWWSERSGGLNKHDLCPKCARNMHSPLPATEAVNHG